MEYNAILWLILMVILVIIEIMTMGLYTIWFAGGSLIAFFATMLGFNVWVQLWAFAIVSAVLLIFTRPVMQKKFNGKTVKTNIIGLIGQKIKLTEKVDNLNRTGRANFNGLDWEVRSEEDDVTYDEGSIVTVVGIEGVKLIVK
jgi:membrane protein implicated in regulation of membrane protease activity